MATTAAPLLIALGVAVVTIGVRRELPGLRLPVTDPVKALAMMRALRTTILGLALVGVAAGWLWQARPLWIVSLVIAGEEILEISVVVAAMRGYLTARAPTPRARRPAPAPPRSGRRR